MEWRVVAFLDHALLEAFDPFMKPEFHTAGNNRRCRLVIMHLTSLEKAAYAVLGYEMCASGVVGIQKRVPA